MGHSDAEYAVPDRVWATLLADIRCGQKLRRLSIDQINDKSHPLVSLSDSKAPGARKTSGPSQGSKASLMSLGRGLRHKFTQFFDSFGRKIEPFAGQHFHYHQAELPANLAFSLANSERASFAYESCGMLVIRIESTDASWIVRRTLDDLRVLDVQLHKCTFNRHYSRLERPQADATAPPSAAHAAAIEMHASQYLKRLTAIARGTLTCGSVLGWFEVDNQGHRIHASAPGPAPAPSTALAINVPAIAFAKVTHAFEKKEDDELELKMGDFVAVIDMPTESESPWWRGKMGLEVGYFPRACVELIRTAVSAEPQQPHPPTSHAPMQTTQATAQTPPAQRAAILPPKAAAAVQPVAPLSKAKSSPALRLPISLGARPPASKEHAQPQGPPHLHSHADGPKASQPLARAIVAELAGGKFASHLRSFFNDRKVAGDVLRRSGILRDPVFGADLAEHCQRSGARVPVVIRRCFEEVEKRGMVRGIYRLSGVSSKVQALRAAFDADEAGVNLDPSDGLDIHCVASLAKLYFRELPNPLLTHALYPEFVDCAQMEDGGTAHTGGPRDTLLQRLTSLLSRLPPPHFATLRLLIEHLGRLIAESDETQMDPKNLGIVWGPNIMRAPGGLAESVLHVKHQARIVEALLTHKRALFGRDSVLVLQSEEAAAEVVEAEKEILAHAAIAEVSDGAEEDDTGSPSGEHGMGERWSSAEYVAADTTHQPLPLRPPAMQPPPVPAPAAAADDGREYAIPSRERSVAVSAFAAAGMPIPPPRVRLGAATGARREPELRRSMSLGATDFASVPVDCPPTAADAADSAYDPATLRRSASNSAHVRPKPLPRPPPKQSLPAVLRPAHASNIASAPGLTQSASLDDVTWRMRSDSANDDGDYFYCDVEPRPRLGSAPDKPLPVPPPVSRGANPPMSTQPSGEHTEHVSGRVDAKAESPRAPPKKLPRPPVKTSG